MTVKNKHSDENGTSINLFIKKSPYVARFETETKFFADLTAELVFHAAGNSLYRDFLSRKGFDPASPFSLEDIPYIPVQVFKTLGVQLSTVPEADIRLTLSSSATSGIPSTVPIDRETARRQAKCMGMVIADRIGKQRRPFLILDVDPAKNRASANFGARAAAVRGYLNFASKASYFVVEKHDGLVFLSDEFVHAVSQLDPATPVVLFGFTYVLYSTVVDPCLKKGEQFHLPPGSHVMHIGGWKKLEGQKVSRERFQDDVHAVFGVQPENIVDVYGFTEHMGLNYPDCQCGCKHTPNLSRVLVRDPKTHAVLPEGQPGLLEFISPLPHSYPGAAVLTDDMGVIVPGACPYGRGGTRFCVLGRAQKAEARGCGDIMSEKLRGVQASVEAKESAGLRLRAWGGTPHDMSSLVDHVSGAREWLSQQPVEAIMGLIDTTARTWMENPALAIWKYNGLSFLSRWCSAANLRALAQQALRGMTGALDGFMPEAARKTHLLHARPVGLVAHWLSGNVPLLSMLVLVQCLVTKNVNILKTASNNFDALEILLGTFAGQRYVTPNGHAITGDDLLRAVALVHYPHADLESARKLSAAVDARIAWGGREAVEAICALPAKMDAADLIFGPKTSFMVIAKDALSDEAAVRKLLRRAATDVSSFDQAACSSPHTIFVEEGGAVTAEVFAQRLGEYLERALTLIPKEPEDDATVAAIQTARAVGDFLGQCWHSEGPGWTVLYDDRVELARPTYSRVITVRPVHDIMDVVPLVYKGIQTIGLAAEGERRVGFALAASGRGALRFPEIGAMTGFDAPWDGIFVMDRLVRWITLGGAASAIATESKAYEGVNMDNFHGKTVLITGSRRGIGRALVTAFAKRGADVVAHARACDDAFEADMAQEAQKFGVSIRPLYFDMTDADAMKTAVNALLKEVVPDVLVNNAGVTHCASFMLTPVKKIQEIFNINLFAQMRLTQMVLKRMIQRKSGNIINVASVAGLDVNSGLCAYGASKAALIAWTKVLAAEFGSYGIRTNALAPGMADTDGAHQMGDKAMSNMLDSCSLHRFASPTEIADIACMIASDEASFVNGAVLRVDGGKV